MLGGREPSILTLPEPKWTFGDPKRPSHELSPCAQIMRERRHRPPTHRKSRHTRSHARCERTYVEGRRSERQSEFNQPSRRNPARDEHQPAAPRSAKRRRKKKSEGLSCRAGAGCGRGLGVTEAKFEALKRTGRCVKGEMTVEIPAAGT